MITDKMTIKIMIGYVQETKIDVIIIILYTVTLIDRTYFI